MSAITVSTTAELINALGSASAGDRIELAPGRYDGLTLRDLEFETPVTITSSDAEERAFFDSQIALFGVSGLTIEGVDVLMADILPASWDPAVRLFETTGVSLIDMRIEGKLPGPEDNAVSLTQLGLPEAVGRPLEEEAWGNGMWVHATTDTVLDRLEITQFIDAIGLNATNNTRIAHSNFHHLRSDGIKLVNTVDTVIEHNLFHSSQPLMPPNDLARSDHPDFLQTYVLGEPGGIDELIVRGNVFAQGDGDPSHTFLAGFALTGPNADQIGFEQIEIYDNLVHTAHLWGFAMFDAQNLEVHHNTLLPAPQDPSYFNSTGGVPAIAIGGSRPDPTYADAPENIHIHSNRLTGFPGDKIVYRNDDVALPPVNVVIEDNTLYSPRAGDETYWADSFGIDPATLVPRADDLMIGAEGGGVRSLDPWLVDWLNDPGDSIERPVEGGNGNDVLEADDTGQKLFGHAGNDTLLGGAGIDTLYSGEGDDVLTGGGGADLFAFRPGVDAEVRITDLSFAEHDYIHLVTGFGRFFFDDAVDPGNLLPRVLDGSSAYVTEVADLIEIVAHDRVSATASGPDTTTLNFDLDGNGQIDWRLHLDGITGIGEDRAAADPITGSEGSDLLVGTASADRLAAGPGADTLTGGDGADVFQLDATVAATGADVISDLDFSAGDRLEFLGLTQTESLQVVDSLSALAALETGGATQLREYDGNIDLLIDRGGDGHAEWTIRLEGVTGADEGRPVLVSEQPIGTTGTLAAGDLRLAYIEPAVLELMGDIG